MANTDLELRQNELTKIAGGKREWYATRKAITATEGRLGVRWNGVTQKYEEYRPNELMKSARGTWGFRMHSQHLVAALTREECLARHLTPGPGNF